MSRSVAVVLFCVLVCAVLAGAQQSGSDLPDLDRTGVVVPWEDFKKILDEIRKPQPTPVAASPPVDYAVSECAAIAVVGGDEKQLRVGLSFSVQVLNNEKWVEVPVIGEGVALASIRMDGIPAQLYRKNGYHMVAFKGEGRHRFRVEYLLPVNENRGTRTAKLRFPQAPVVTVDLQVPRSDVDLQVDGAVIQAVSRSATQTRIQAALGRVSDTSVSWFKRVAAEDRESKVFGELATLVSIGEAVLRGTTTASYTIHGRGLGTFRLDIPTDITVLGVDVHGLEGWQVIAAEEGAERQTLEVELSYLAQGSLGFSFNFEQALSGTSAEIELPDIAIIDVLRERGFLAVAAATNVEISPGDGLENAVPIDPSELPTALTARSGEGVLYGFKFLRHPVVVPLSVVKHQDVAVKRTMVESAELLTFLNQRGKLVTSARYTVKNNRKQYLELRLPEGATLWGAYLEGQPVKAARRDDGGILVPLRKTATGTAGQLRPFLVEVVYFEESRRLGRFGQFGFRAPVLDVDVLEINWEFYLPRVRRYFGFRGNLEEDPGANRIALVGGAVYNLAVPSDMQLLDIENRDGDAYLTDGINEAPVSGVKVRAAGKERLLNSGEVSQIQAEEEKTETDADQEALPAGREQSAEFFTQAGRTQASNVAAFQQVAGGRALGVLPVRIQVPKAGLRLRFSGRLLTADETAELKMGYIPAGWRLPKLGLLWTLILAFGLSLTLMFFFDLDAASGRTTRWLGILATGLGLVAVLVSSGGHRLAFFVACAVAVIGFALLSQLREPPRSGGSF